MSTAMAKLPEFNYKKIEFHMMEEMYAALCMCMCTEKTTFLGKGDLAIVKLGKVIMGLRAPLPNHIPACRSEFIWTNVA